MKFAYREEFERDTSPRIAAYILVRENSSAGIIVSITSRSRML
ncbi:MAG: palindromic element RPE1 domain-containing protein [Rickettsia endosymbiont of Ixodes ricinus]|nr:palindromic element RPE1 domain-containing protein [Rickettsia helvetica]MCZ6883890.1 palindromic element RPE1 domain-containing protein [Rickettsia endosymbiont of Ixodes ricinus]MCZ6896859.1 palindromic element RPE1 domain-containing protein [Rickettsia endosymbiont of Ixodes ricinus]